MGVSLERVQFKFASIIGELCSEPLVLSQFAVWLDLRLAEYKSKGSISLDCCGMLPEPDWLKGLKPPTIPSEPVAPGDQALSGDLGDSFFSLAKETNSQDFTSLRHSFSSHKSQRHFPNHQIEPQSSPAVYRHAESAQSETNMSPDVVVVPEEDDIPTVVNSSHAQQSYFTSKNSTVSSHSEPSLSHDSSPSRRAYHVSNFSHLRSTHRVAPYKFSAPNDSESRKRNSTERNIAAAVSSFQRWILEEPRNDKREITDISAPELDSYLAEFFSVMKKPSGEDYTRRSFSVYRYSLDRYLKEHKYPFSICKSEEFLKSQRSFHRRKLSLPEMATDQYRINTAQLPPSYLLPLDKPSAANISSFPAGTSYGSNAMYIPENPPEQSDDFDVVEVMELNELREVERVTGYKQSATASTRTEKSGEERMGWHTEPKTIQTGPVENPGTMEEYPEQKSIKNLSLETIAKEGQQSDASRDFFDEKETKFNPNSNSGSEGE
ncbi:uncharacterized protein LOC135463772 isoform X2 [Liolophura sinensis]